jgi:molecular chaperone HscB
MSSFNFKQNYFSLFQIAERFSVDEHSLASRYRELQKETHPDRFAAGSDQQKRLAVQYSAWVNEAYETLKAPVARAHYLLSLKGHAFDSQQTIGNDPAFLLHQMSLREQLSELKDQADPEQALDHLRDELEELIDHQCTAFKDDYEQEDFQSAKIAASKMQFLFKLEAEVERVEEDILDY